MNKSTLINATRQKDTVTANNAVTNSTSLSNCLDLFFLAGASRKAAMEDDMASLIVKFERALQEDKILTYKILFWARDCRGGAGEKKFFQNMAKYIQDRYPHDWVKLYVLIPVYGYWKDLFTIETPTNRTIEFLANTLSATDEGTSSLLAKWFPRKGVWFNTMHKAMKVLPKAFRKYLVSRTNVVETQMCNNEWDKIEYSKIPSIAMHKYRNTFGRRDAERFTKFNEAVIKGEETVNASVLYPHSLYEALQGGQDETAVQAQWMSLPNYLENSNENILPVCDVSGSMNGLPMAVSVSLGLYISERNESIFKNAFITFSGNPEMVYITGGTLLQKMSQIESADWGMNTNIDGVFNLILESSVKGNVPEKDMPTKILIISDMEFDQSQRDDHNMWGLHEKCVRVPKWDITAIEMMEQKYKDAGYKMPGIIFWNVNGRVGNVPANEHHHNVGLVSGFSPAILTSILGGEEFTPKSLMLKALNVERYDAVSECLTS